MGIIRPDYEDEILSELDEELSEPSMYRVYLLNDDYTPMEFVVTILMTVFNLPEEESTRIMISVHKNGSGLCGVFTYEIAETKVATVHSLAEENGFPLRSIMEKE